MRAVVILVAARLIAPGLASAEESPNREANRPKVQGKLVPIIVGYANGWKFGLYRHGRGPRSGRVCPATSGRRRKDDGTPHDAAYLTDREADEACRFIEGQRERPFFLYMPRYSVHTPLQAKQPLIERYQKKVTAGMNQTNATYAAMIHSLDESVGRVMAKLDELNLTDRTVVCFTSDNGGLIGGGKRHITSNVPLRAGKGSAYEGGVREPLIVRWPGVTTPGSTCGEAVIGVDYFPTLLEIAGVSIAAGGGHAPDGVSLTPLLKNPRATLGREAIFWHYPHYHPGGATPYSAIRSGDYRLVEFYEDQRVELYNLRADIG